MRQNKLLRNTSAPYRYKTCKISSKSKHFFILMATLLSFCQMSSSYADETSFASIGASGLIGGVAALGALGAGIALSSHHGGGSGGSSQPTPPAPSPTPPPPTPPAPPTPPETPYVYALLFSKSEHKSAIEKFNNYGLPLESWELGSDFYSGMAMDPKGNFYLVNQSKNTIQKLDKQGQQISSWGQTGQGDGQFNAPTRIAISKNCHVYVTDTGNNRVQEFDQDGKFITKWGMPGAILPYMFNTPIGITVDNANNVYVVDTKNKRMQKFTGDGTYLDSLDNDYFQLSLGIACDAHNNIFVPNPLTNEVMQLQSDFSTWKIFTKEAINPVSLTLDDKNNVYVNLSEGIEKFDATGIEQTFYIPSHEYIFPMTVDVAVGL